MAASLAAAAASACSSCCPIHALLATADGSAGSGPALASPAPAAALRAVPLWLWLRLWFWLWQCVLMISSRLENFLLVATMSLRGFCRCPFLGRRVLGFLRKGRLCDLGLYVMYA